MVWHRAEFYEHRLYHNNACILTLIQYVTTSPFSKHIFDSNRELSLVGRNNA